MLEELKRLQLFSACGDDALQRLLSQPCRRQEYEAGREILTAGDPCRSLMILSTGSAEARMVGEEDREVIVDLLEGPVLLAPAFLFSPHNEIPVDVTAKTDCCVWFINKEAFFNFMLTEPTVLRTFLETLSDKGRFLSRKMRSFAVQGLHNRVLEYLEVNGTITSVAKAAQQLGVTRPSLSRILSEMLASGILSKDVNGYRKN
ncbi:MAG: Crp/Fnr family transcriptional regulator [Bacteroidales bacterium]|nr:Crp/Fnr family transcriptional regulator [Bacteroidales bacterium]